MYLSIIPIFHIIRSFFHSLFSLDPTSPILYPSIICYNCFPLLHSHYQEAQIPHISLIYLPAPKTLFLYLTSLSCLDIYSSSQSSILCAWSFATLKVSTRLGKFPRYRQPTPSSSKEDQFGSYTTLHSKDRQRPTNYLLGFAHFKISNSPFNLCTSGLDELFHGFTDSPILALIVHLHLRLPLVKLIAAT